MGYNLYNNFVNKKGFSCDESETLRMDIQLNDVYGAPLIIYKDTVDPGSFIYPDWKWEFIERRSGGNAVSKTNVDVLDRNKAMVSITLPPKTLTSRFGYRHVLSMKWAEEDSSKWNVVASGLILTNPQSGDYSTLSA